MAVLVVNCRSSLFSASILLGNRNHNYTLVMQGYSIASGVMAMVTVMFCNYSQKNLGVFTLYYFNNVIISRARSIDKESRFTLGCVIRFDNGC